MAGDALALELDLDRREAALLPELRLHDRAVLAAALADRDPPPPPAMLLEPAWLELPRRAAACGDPTASARAATLARWSLAARVATDPAMRAAAGAARDLDGLAARHAALAAAARRLRFADAGGLVAALYGAAPTDVADEDGDEHGDAVDEGGDGDRVDDAPSPAALDRTTLPEGAALLAALARAQRIDPSPITLHAAPRSLTIVIAGERVHCLVGRGDDRLAHASLTAHELGHGLHAAARWHLPPTLAAPRDRVDDEAAAARAVRALEAMTDDATVRVALVRRRHRRERLTRALAAFEADSLRGVSPAHAWARVAAIDARPPAAFAALFDEPGVMAAYAAADRRAAAPAGQGG